jgi:hypothetical protein
LCALASAAYWFRAIRSRRLLEQPVVRALGVFVAIANLLFIAGLIGLFRNLGETVPLPTLVTAWLLLPLASVAIVPVLAVCAGQAWYHRWWTRGERVMYTTFVASSLAFLLLLNYWKLLGFRY